MVTITASYTVTPKKSTPQGRLWLTDLDQLFHLHRTPLIFVYKATNNNTFSIERLKNSLSEILVHYYPMAGRLCITENGRIEVDLNAKGAVLFEAETKKTISDFGDFSPSDSIKQLIPTIDNKSLEEIPIFAVQLTRFSCNKGFVIGTSFFHVLSDGVGFSSFIKSWAELARSGTFDEKQKPFLDRTMLNFSFSHPEFLIPPRFDHVELNPPPLILGRSDDVVERNKKTTAELLRLSVKQVEILKKKANEIDSLNGTKLKRSRGYSRYEAIAAHIWRCASKARELEEKQETLVGFNVEIRSKIIPPLSKNYFGNCLISTATKGYIGEITSKSLGYVAEKIRKANEMVTDEYIKSQVNVIRSKACLDGGDKNAAFYGNPNLRFTSWINMPVYDADFGCGKPVYFGLGYVCPYDRAIILLSSDGDGSVIVCMHLQVAHMQLFKKFFYEDIHEMLTSSRL